MLIKEYKINMKHVRRTPSMIDIRMTNMTKLTVLALIAAFAAAFLISSLSAAEGDYTEAVSVLSHLDVLKGYGDGSLHESDNVERYQMALFISRLMTGHLDDNYWNVPLDDSVPFEDVRADFTSKYCGAINLCYENNIINGRDASHFAPHDAIKYKEALAMICRSAGLIYSDYPGGYIRAAARIGLDDNMDGVGYDDFLTRGQTAQLLFNLMKALSGISDGDGSFNYTGRTYFNDFKKLEIKDVRTRTGFRAEYSVGGSVFWEYDCPATNGRPDVFYSYADYKKNSPVDPDQYYLSEVYAFRLHDGTVAGLVDIPVYDSGEIVYSGGARTIELETVTGRVVSVKNGKIKLENTGSDVKQLKTGFTGCASVPKLDVKVGETYTFYVYDGFAVDIASHHTYTSDTAVIVDIRRDTATALLMSDGFETEHELKLANASDLSRLPAAVTFVRDDDGICTVTELDTRHGRFVYKNGSFVTDVGSVEYDVVDGVPVRLDGGRDAVDRSFFSLRASGEVTPKSYRYGKGTVCVCIRDGDVDIMTDTPAEGCVVEGDFVFSSLVDGGYCIVYAYGDLYSVPETDNYVVVPDSLTYAYEEIDDGFSFYIGGIKDIKNGDELDVCISPVSDGDIDRLIDEVKTWNRRIYPGFAYIFDVDSSSADFDFTYVDYAYALVASHMHEAAATLTYDELHGDALPLLLDAYNDSVGGSYTEYDVARVSYSGDKLTDGLVYAVGIDLDRGAMAFSATLYAVGVTVDDVTYTVGDETYTCSVEAVMDGYPEIEDAFRERGIIPFGAVLRASGLESDNAVDGEATATVTVGGHTFTLLISGGSVHRDHVDSQDGVDGVPGTGVITADTLDRAPKVRDGYITFDTLAGGDPGFNAAYLYWRGHETMTLSRTVVLAEFSPERVDDGSGDGFEKCAASFSLAANVYGKGDEVEICTLAIDWDFEPELDMFFGEEPPVSTLAYDSDGTILFGEWYFYGAVDTDTHAVRVATYDDYENDLDKAVADPSYVPVIRAVKLRVVPCLFAPLYVSSDADEDGERVNVAFIRTVDGDGKKLEYGAKKMYSPLDALFTANVTLSGGTPSIPSIPSVDGSDFAAAAATFRFTYSRGKLALSFATPRVW